MSIISNIFSEVFVNAAGWTILHSVWQGAAVAFGFALLMYFMRRSSSNARYGVGIAALGVMLTMSTVTFMVMFDAGSAGEISGPWWNNLSIGAAVANVAPTGLNSAGESGIIPLFTRYFSQHLPLVVTFWFLGVMVLMLKLGGGFLYNQRLKSHNTKSVSAGWNKKLTDFNRRLRTGKTIGFLESALVKVPLTIGHFKPVILFPLGMLSGLPQQQVEALLLHELAHIARKDYLVNVLQHMMDILYFYHPAVRWISSSVRMEREHCCDDIAVSLMGNSHEYARALTSAQQFGFGGMEPALAATGNKFRLLGRIKRIIASSNTGDHNSSRFLGVLLLTVCVLGSAFAINAASKKSGLDSAAEQHAATTKKTPKKKPIGIQNKYANYEDYNIVSKGDCILELSGKINPKKMPSGLRLLNSDGKTVWSLFDIKNGKYKNASSFYERIDVKKGSYSLKGASIKNFSFSNAGGELHVKKDKKGNFTQYFLIPGKKNNRSSIFLIPADSPAAPKTPKTPKAPKAPAEVHEAPETQTAEPAPLATPAPPAAPAPPADPDNVTEAEKLKLKKLEKQLKK
ncbi:MAG: M56 family metallopeptidase, partial [bacterium]|nr:M56 family metallopeptidase [bacterium]